MPRRPVPPPLPARPVADSLPALEVASAAVPDASTSEASGAVAVGEDEDEGAAIVSEHVERDDVGGDTGSGASEDGGSGGRLSRTETDPFPPLASEPHIQEAKRLLQEGKIGDEAYEAVVETSHSIRLAERKFREGVISEDDRNAMVETAKYV